MAVDVVEKKVLVIEGTQHIGAAELVFGSIAAALLFGALLTLGYRIFGQPLK